MNNKINIKDNYFFKNMYFLTSSRKSPTSMLQRHKWGWGLAKATIVARWFEQVA